MSRQEREMALQILIQNAVRASEQKFWENYAASQAAAKEDRPEE